MTNVERCRRHFGQSSLCPVCNEADESILHVLQDCCVASAIWQCLVPSSLLPEFYESNLQAWIINNVCSRLLHPEGDIPWSYLFLSSLWQIWKSRNDLVFNNVAHPTNAILGRAITWTRYYSDICQQNNVTAPNCGSTIPWKQPEPDCKETVQMLNALHADNSPFSLVRAIAKLR
ncbi:hypothetical protein V6N11_050376 [Hibiscus sabdariffa]|uniref:Reverse transcriptase zinc-binding domain-containing protein n=1 Tax=Hibiscus sabdariffa TaxID=183260 RepID=A0ABR2TA02_9ROSI